ncbi:hypothetical protein [uncultured Mitsuokella sp.]|uniref:hypothetical protein n=1 Tax=uncultured Mitsuokella sp. TaxID=453120 RepID=UPI0026708405|nr:hypothetical protein [uncultured Mitsuokella sp.]
MRTWLEKIIGQRGQGIVEYALLLAFVVGCAAAVFSNNGLANGIKQTFSQVADTLNGNHLPDIDETGYTDEEKQDKQSMDDIARAVEKAIRNEDIVFTDGYTAFLVVQKESNKSFVGYLMERGVIHSADEAPHLDGNILDSQGSRTNNGTAISGISWPAGGKPDNFSWTAPNPNGSVSMTDMWGIVGKYGSNGLSSQSVKSSTSGYYGVAITSNGNNSYTTTYYRGARTDYEHNRGIYSNDAIGSVTWSK